MEHFDSLRREASKLERALEDSIARYQQLAQRLTTDRPHASPLISHSPPFQDPTDDEQESSLAADINRTISQLSELLNTQMAPAAESTGKAQHALLVKRYREILFDGTADFHKTCTVVSRHRDTQELFRDAAARTHIAATGRDPSMEQLLRERTAIGNSLKSATSVLGQASEIHAELRHQQQSLRTVKGELGSLLSKVPGVNLLMDQLVTRRNREDWIVSGVLAGCILITLWYLLA